MNLRNVLRTYALLRQLSDDESALLATLRSMSDTERELLVESLQPERKATKSAPTRTVEKCSADGCDYTRRAAVHKDSTADGYHEFQPPKPGEKKSQRAQKIADTLKTNLHPQRPTNNGKCTYSSEGKICLGAEGDAIHDLAMGYAGYHEFVAPSAQVTSGG